MSYWYVLMFAGFLMPILLIVGLLDVTISKDKHFIAFYKATFYYTILIAVLAILILIYAPNDVFDKYYKELGIVPTISVLMFYALKVIKKVYTTVNVVS